MPQGNKGRIASRSNHRRIALTRKMTVVQPSDGTANEITTLLTEW
jgi:hypothetical protein